ncbi:predicted protein [Nematostella vectensis]|uniref:BHLH domain-containing protein n=1 Tax=Nematostella vectensis TaxID=45351 RepID=A7SDD5_NEMVE|nr:predicted protein [Nematostella vectensis]|eukprot:XP_001630355.1 predicted protein [Nematostella vectensis]
MSEVIEKKKKRVEKRVDNNENEVHSVKNGVETIAPAKKKTKVALESLEGSNTKVVAKKKCTTLAFHMEPSAVARRNERERNRVRLVNDGFSSLRQHIPYFPEKKKLSKVETLRCAVAYIKHLQSLIEEYDAEKIEAYTEHKNGDLKYESWVVSER